MNTENQTHSVTPKLYAQAMRVLDLAVAWNQAKTSADRYAGDSIAEFRRLSKSADEAQRKLRVALGRLENKENPQNKETLKPQKVGGG